MTGSSLQLSSVLAERITSKTPNLDTPLQTQRDITQVQATYLQEGMYDFVGKYEKLQDIQTFSQFRSDFNKYITSIFASAGIFEGKSPSFKDAFEKGSISEFEGEKEEKQQLKELITEKSKLYRVTFLLAIQKGLFSNIFNAQDISTIHSILVSNVFGMFDEMFLDWEREAEIVNGSPQKDELLPQLPLDQVPHGGIKRGKIVGYKDFLRDGEAKVRQSLFSIDSNFIPEGSVKSYFLGLLNLIQGGITDYNTWKENERFQLVSWRDDSTSLGIGGPIESYYAREQLIEPELYLYHKTVDTSLNQNAKDLSDKYYNDGYGMENVRFYNVENLIAGGARNLYGITGQNFPNDAKLAEQEGTYILFKSSQFDAIYDSAATDLGTLFGGKIPLNKEAIRGDVSEFIAYHEYGHSLFKKNNPSDLEESKASLFYFLKIFDDNQQGILTPEKRKDIIYGLLFDTIRDLRRMGDGGHRMYEISMRIILRGMFERGIIFWGENDELEINITEENFGLFLNDMKDQLEYIKKSYLSPEGLNQSEETFIEIVDTQTNEDISKMRDIMGLKKL